ncbi:putative C6 transcription factor [Boeremia exigua]|uniref:putative C6 transcription factor n=1 Tax=Boeremia exigua TaxID=749465 RepID=UPI001E8DD4BD|nr:putative C6 transcription factor [Boeremia exigua]KAH6639228.1 putative C6 transcription factor [Boeremia exigua]
MSNTSATRQLPTRVSAACDRCRKNKSRCDPFRPCSLCVRANIDCSSTHVETPVTRATKRRRTRISSRETSRDRTETSRVLSEVAQEDASVQRLHITDPGAVSEEPGLGESTRPNSVDREADSAMGIAQRIYRLGNQPSLNRTTSAFPGGGNQVRNTVSRVDRTHRKPVASILGYPLPTLELMHTLLEEYFDAVHWFSLVIYEPKFRPAFQTVQDGLAFPSQKSFLLLLSTVLGMGAWYKSHRNGVDTCFPNEDWGAWSQTLLQGAEKHLTELMDQTSIASVQVCILLGSYLVYHGKPNLSFALLGATIRTAQAIGLHRQPLRGTQPSIEERKRVWWTIYTWDRFASVTYGRPLGINDKDCNVTHPADTFESRSFKPDLALNGDTAICYSTYQRELNKLYLAASPLIEVIFGMRAVGSNGQDTSKYMDQIVDVTGRVWAWRQQLPPHLRLDLDTDCRSDQPSATNVHHLQALSLQLTFDSLLIIFYRPLLAQQVDHLIRNQSQPDTVHMHAESPSCVSDTASSPLFAASATSPLSRSQISSTEQWWDAALRTSKVTEMPQLAQLATDSHLVAFLAINLFNSAIVMAVLALSDPLSDRAQHVKRTITRTFRLQEVLGKKTQLSVQSNNVLKDVIHMLLRREADAMLSPIMTSDQQSALGNTSTVPEQAPTLMSVEETLRLPVQLPMGTATNHTRHRRSTADRAMRLNESLASVQQAFPLGLDGGYNATATNNQDWSQNQELAADIHQATLQDWPHVPLQDLTELTEPGWDESNNIDATGNGLYWFWDTIWNEPRSHP